MSDMFRGFYSEPLDYVPDNMHKPPIPPKQISLVADNLDIILDKNGKKKGYSWNYGETVSIPITVDVPIRVEADAYCSDVEGEEPTIDTAGRIGQKFYNTRDMRSWVLISYAPNNMSFIWKEDPRFTFPEDGERMMVDSPNMNGKYILAEFINFRGEQMFERLYEDVNSAEFVIDITDSLNIHRGIYDLYIYVGDEENQYKKLTKRYEIVVR